MENNNYVHVGNIIEQERQRRQAQILKSIDSNVFDHIEKAHNNDLADYIQKAEDDNLSKFANDVSELNKAESEFLLSKIQRQINIDSKSVMLHDMRNIVVNHIEKAWKIQD